MKCNRTVYNKNLRTPDSVTVEVGKTSKTFEWADRKAVSKWIESIWEKEIEESYGMNTSEAYIYYNIDWDCDHILAESYKCVSSCF